METLSDGWAKIQEIPGADWVIGIAGLIIFLLVAFYVVKLFRDMALGGGFEAPATDFLSELQQMRDEGKLGEFEFVRLKKTMPQQNAAPEQLGLNPDIKQSENKLVENPTGLMPEPPSGAENIPAANQVEFEEVEEDNGEPGEVDKP